MNELEIVEYEDIRVLTTKQVAEYYETEEKRISENFNANKRPQSSKLVSRCSVCK